LHNDNANNYQISSNNDSLDPEDDELQPQQQLDVNCFNFNNNNNNNNSNSKNINNNYYYYNYNLNYPYIYEPTKSKTNEILQKIKRRTFQEIIQRPILIQIVALFMWIHSKFWRFYYETLTRRLQ